MTETRILAIESSCDETAVALIRENDQGSQIDSSIISSQIELHREHGGVVPELASRNHCEALPQLIDQCLKEADCPISNIDGFAATSGPGLASSLMVGASAAKGMALATKKPFYAINHLEGHLLSPFLSSGTEFRPNLSLIVSGGHTMLVDCTSIGTYELYGKSRDDAAGEAFDKVGKMLGLPYPGGPEIEKHAKLGNPAAFEFPRSMMRRDERDFSFSGLKTAVLYALPPLVKRYKEANQALVEGLRTQDLNNICASFQAAVIEVLVRKTIRAAKDLGRKVIGVSGGVSCNQSLRDALEQAAQTASIDLLLPARSLTTDNAAMIGYVAMQKHKLEKASALTDDIDPNLPLTSFDNRAKASKTESK